MRGRSVFPSNGRTAAAVAALALSGAGASGSSPLWDTITGAAVGDTALLSIDGPGGVFRAADDFVLDGSGGGGGPDFLVTEIRVLAFVAQSPALASARIEVWSDNAGVPQSVVASIPATINNLGPAANFPGFDEVEVLAPALTLSLSPDVRYWVTALGEGPGQLFVQTSDSGGALQGLESQFQELGAWSPASSIPGVDPTDLGFIVNGGQGGVDGSATVEVHGPAFAAPGETVTLSVVVTGVDFLNPYQVAGFGLDFRVTSGATHLSSLGPVDHGVMNIGELPGEIDADSIDRVVGGQAPNLFELNPALATQSLPVTLFTAEVTVDAGASIGSTAVFEAAYPSSGRGGVVLYEVGVGSVQPFIVGEEPCLALFTTPLVVTVALPCVGDLDGDGSTLLSDFSIFAGNFGQSVPPGTGGDFDGDGFVLLNDFSVFASDFGCTP